VGSGQAAGEAGIVALVERRVEALRGYKDWTGRATKPVQVEALRARAQ
jgi:hypothetical protein